MLNLFMEIISTVTSTFILIGYTLVFLLPTVSLIAGVTFISLIFLKQNDENQRTNLTPKKYGNWTNFKMRGDSHQGVRRFKKIYT